MRRLLLPLLFFLLPGAPALAETAVTCHCFQDRVFDPHRPRAADDYFLAAAQNALFAAVSGIDKKSVVRAKMAGADGAELWVSWYLATQGGVSRDAVTAARGDGAGWRQVVQGLRLSPERLAPAVAQGVLRNAPTLELAAAVVDTVLRERCRASAEELRALRNSGAGDREIILALVVAAQPRRPAAELWQLVKTGGQSWGRLLAETGLNADNLEARVRTLTSTTSGNDS